jgi:hypothetical protein
MNRRTTQLVLLTIVVLVMAAPAFAQSTPVPIVVDTNEIFTQTNTWIEVFLPIIAIGVGISVALAILTFIGNQIVKAIRGN